MATRIQQPNNIRAATHYPQYQETNVNLPTLPDGKFFGVTKRVDGISMSTLLTKVSGVKVLYPDNANGVIDRNRTWLTGTISRQQAVRVQAFVLIQYNLQNGETITREYNNSAIGANDFLGENNSAQSGGTFNGLNVSRSIQTGKVTFTISNNTGSARQINDTTWVNVFKDTQEIANFLYNEVRKGTPVFAEWNENGMPHHKCEEIFAKLYAIVKANDNTVVNPQDTNIFNDYYANNNAFGTDLGTLELSESQLKQGLSTEALARSFYNINTGSFQTSNYFTQNAVSYRNRMVGGYYDGIRHTYNGNYIYETIYNLEKAFVAIKDRKTGVFAWGSYEGVSQAIETHGSWERLPWTNPSGDIMRLQIISGSFGMTLAQAFYSLLLGNTYVMWHDGTVLGTDINCFASSFTGANNNKFQPTGGSIQDYNPDAPASGQPIRVCSPNQARWSGMMETFHNGAFSGAYILGTIKNRVNTSLKYANFSYNDDGTLRTGYPSGNAPVLGSLGNAAVSRYGVSNYGQHNIVDALTNKKPVVMYGTGSEGDVFIIWNPWASILGTTSYTINEGTPITIQHNGPELGVYIR